VPRRGQRTFRPFCSRADTLVNEWQNATEFDRWPTLRYSLWRQCQLWALLSFQLRDDSAAEGAFGQRGVPSHFPRPASTQNSRRRARSVGDVCADIAQSFDTRRWTPARGLVCVKHTMCLLIRLSARLNARKCWLDFRMKCTAYAVLLRPFWFLFDFSHPHSTKHGQAFVHVILICLSTCHLINKYQLSLIDPRDGSCCRQSLTMTVINYTV